MNVFVQDVTSNRKFLTGKTIII